MPRSKVFHVTLCCSLLTFSLSICVLDLFAQSPIPDWPEFHRKDITQWANKTGLSFEFVNQLTREATKGEVENEADEYWNQYEKENIDAKTLSAQEHLLLATWDPGTGHYLRICVLKRRGAGFEVIWRSSENFATASILGAARTQATPDGKIIVSFRYYSKDYDPEKSGAPIIKVTVTFKWNGTTYVNTGRREQPEKVQR
jgi:hypothetical protein